MDGSMKRQYSEMTDREFHAVAGRLGKMTVREIDAYRTRIAVGAIILGMAVSAAVAWMAA